MLDAARAVAEQHGLRTRPGGTDPDERVGRFDQAHVGTLPDSDPMQVGGGNGAKRRVSRTAAGSSRAAGGVIGSPAVAGEQSRVWRCSCSLPFLVVVVPSRSGYRALPRRMCPAGVKALVKVRAPVRRHRHEEGDGAADTDVGQAACAGESARGDDAGPVDLHPLMNCEAQLVVPSGVAGCGEAGQGCARGAGRGILVDADRGGEHSGVQSGVVGEGASKEESVRCPSPAVPAQRHCPPWGARRRATPYRV